MDDWDEPSVGRRHRAVDVRGLRDCGRQPVRRANSQGADAETVDAQPVRRPAETAKAADEQKFVSQIKNRTTRSLSTGEREQIAEIAKEKPNIDLEITFDYNSANISQKALPAVAGARQGVDHPDLKGTPSCSPVTPTQPAATATIGTLRAPRQRLKKHLMEKYGIAAADLVTVGYGKTKLKNAGTPTAEENRRVQVVNMASSKVAGN